MYLMQREELPPELVAAEARLAQLQANKAADMKESNNAGKVAKFTPIQECDAIVPNSSKISRSYRKSLV